MSTTPFSAVTLGLTLTVTDLLNVPPPTNPLILRQISNLAFQAGLNVQAQEYLRLSSTTPISIFGGTQVPVVYVRNTSPQGIINMEFQVLGAAGFINTTSLGTEAMFHTPYAVGDTGIIVGANNNATYIITGVDGFGVPTSFNLTSGGTGYSVASNVATARAGAQPGSGSGMTINILTVGQGNTAQLATIGPGGVFLWFQPVLDAANDNAIGGLSLASQNSAVVIAEYLWAQ